MNDRSAHPALEIRGLNVFYGASHALQGVDLTLDGGVLSVVGRNGMGKTTLCKTVMGLLSPASGDGRAACTAWRYWRCGAQGRGLCAAGATSLALAQRTRTFSDAGAPGWQLVG